MAADNIQLNEEDVRNIKELAFNMPELKSITREALTKANKPQHIKGVNKMLDRWGKSMSYNATVNRKDSRPLAAITSDIGRGVKKFSNLAASQLEEDFYEPAKEFGKGLWRGAVEQFPYLLAAAPADISKMVFDPYDYLSVRYNLPNIGAKKRLASPYAFESLTEWASDPERKDHWSSKVLPVIQKPDYSLGEILGSFISDPAIAGTKLAVIASSFPTWVNRARKAGNIPLDDLGQTLRIQYNVINAPDNLKGQALVDYAINRKKKQKNNRKVLTDEERRWMEAELLDIKPNATKKDIIDITEELRPALRNYLTVGEGHPLRKHISGQKLWSDPKEERIYQDPFSGTNYADDLIDEVVDDLSRLQVEKTQHWNKSDIENFKDTLYLLSINDSFKEIIKKGEIPAAKNIRNILREQNMSYDDFALNVGSQSYLAKELFYEGGALNKLAPNIFDILSKDKRLMDLVIEGESGMRYGMNPYKKITFPNLKIGEQGEVSPYLLGRNDEWYIVDNNYAGTDSHSLYLEGAADKADALGLFGSKLKDRYGAENLSSSSTTAEYSNLLKAKEVHEGIIRETTSGALKGSFEEDVIAIVNKDRFPESTREGSLEPDFRHHMEIRELAAKEQGIDYDDTGIYMNIATTRRPFRVKLNPESSPILIESKHVEEGQFDIHQAAEGKYWYDAETTPKKIESLVAEIEAPQSRLRRALSRVNEIDVLEKELRKWENAKAMLPNLSENARAAQLVRAGVFKAINDDIRFITFSNAEIIKNRHPLMGVIKKEGKVSNADKIYGAERGLISRQAKKWAKSLGGDEYATVRLIKPEGFATNFHAIPDDQSRWQTEARQRFFQSHLESNITEPILMIQLTKKGVDKIKQVGVGSILKSKGGLVKSLKRRGKAKGGGLVVSIGVAPISEKQVSKFKKALNKREEKRNGGAIRNYRKEYDNYQSRNEQKKDRAGRNAARRKMIKNGSARKGDSKDVHHRDKNPRNNSSSNLSLLSKKSNRSFKRA